MQKLKLNEFNNLTKNLSLSIYDVCYAKTSSKKDNYITYMDEKYNANYLTKILKKTCSIIGANILNITYKDYEPIGASVTMLIGEESDNYINLNISRKKDELSKLILAHLDKSHICVHTYLESHPTYSLCTFRMDIEVSTCGLISPLKSLNYFIYQLESDIVTIDYRIRGFTRDIHGIKHFIDHKINSIQNFISNEVKLLYNMVDVNVYQENIFHTKMILKKLDLNHHLFSDNLKNFSKDELENVYNLLYKEMQEIFYGKNLPE